MYGNDSSREGPLCLVPPIWKKHFLSRAIVDVVLLSSGIGTMIFVDLVPPCFKQQVVTAMKPRTRRSCFGIDEQYMVLVRDSSKMHILLFHFQIGIRLGMSSIAPLASAVPDQIYFWCTVALGCGV